MRVKRTLEGCASLEIGAQGHGARVKGALEGCASLELKGVRVHDARVRGLLWCLTGSILFCEYLELQNSDLCDSDVGIKHYRTLRHEGAEGGRDIRENEVTGASSHAQPRVSASSSTRPRAALGL